MAFPASVGLIWHVSDRVALRPDVSFSWSSSTTPPDALVTSTGRGTSYGVGLSGLFYVGKWEGLSAYLSPRFSYARTSTMVTTTLPGGFEGSIRPTISTHATEGTNSAYSLSGSFGAQYSLSRKFGVFGEAGLGYNETRSSSSSLTSTGSTAHGLGTRAGVGVLFYF
jgi:hypothetical protein